MGWDVCCFGDHCAVMCYDVMALESVESMYRFWLDGLRERGEERGGWAVMGLYDRFWFGGRGVGLVCKLREGVCMDFVTSGHGIVGERGGRAGLKFLL